MEEQWVMDRAQLRRLLEAHPDWSLRQYAQACGRCRKWVQKWRQRLHATDPADLTALHSQSRARKTPPERYHPQVIARILELRDHPPASMPRKLGAPAIRYWLHQDAQLQAAGHRLPRSTSTIGRILRQHQRIHRPPKVEHTPFERPDPLDTWEMDFTDVATAQARHHHKQQHQVEALAVVDRGSSLLVDLQADDDYHTETVMLALASTFLQQGLPRCLVCDRDPRLVGSWSSQEFPSAFMRFVLNLGVTLQVCPPQRPDRKPFVERYFRTLHSECVQVSHPADVAQTRELFAQHRFTYNQLRPNQASACGNRPPAVAFPTLPLLPALPAQVDPDRWLLSYHNRFFRRRVSPSGRIQIDRHAYFVRRDLAGRYVVCRLDAQRRVFDIQLDNRVLKTVSIRGLYDTLLDFGDYLDVMLGEAAAERRRLARERRLRTS